MDVLLTRRAVERRCGIGRSTIYRLMRQSPPAFPLPIRVGMRSVLQSSREIEEWVASRDRATGEAA